MKSRAFLAAFLAVGLAAAMAALLAAAEPASKPAAAAGGATTQPGDKQTTASGLTIIYTQPSGVGAQAGDMVWVEYTGKLKDGTVFDSSEKQGKPIDFQLGRGMVIKGWDEGIQGMSVGEKRQLVIPPTLAYGERGAGDVIPPNATLTFDVELVGLRKTPQSGQAAHP
jgi:peptidylprolyl isomerase